MSCWVVPDVAAELWGLSINQILERVRDGRIPSKLEMGFLMVEVASSDACNTANTARPVRKNRPPTYMTINPREDSDLSPALVFAGADDESETFTIDWRQKRMQASLMRRRPAA